jgi:U4/U6 small nuclear ribonucleoprotein PRP4
LQASIGAKTFCEPGCHIRTAMAEYYDLNEDSKEEQLRHAEVLRKFEAHKRARSVTVPTAIPEVKAKLRELGHPITLFGEDHADRRERLREVVAMLELDQEQLDKMQAFMNQSSAGPALGMQATGTANAIQDKSASVVPHKETFYSPALDALVTARKDIATYSFAQAQKRLHTTRRIRDDSVLEAEETKVVRDLYIHSKEMTLNSSQFGDDRPVTAVRYSADGKLVCSGSLSGVVKVWDAENLSNRAVLRGTLDRITSVCWHPEARLGQDGPALLAASSAEGCCHIYDFNKVSAEGSHSTEQGSSGAMDVQHQHEEGDADGSDSGSEDGDSMDEEEGEGQAPAATESAPRASQQSVVHKLEGHRGMVTACDFHPTGRYLATAGHDCSWRLWDVEQGRELQLQDGHAKDLSALAFHPDGSLLLSADSGGVVLLWDLRSGLSIQTFQGHIKKISSAGFSANGFQAATGSLDNSVRIWDLRRKKCAYTLPAHTNIVSDVRYSRSGELLLTSSFDNSIKIWGARDFTLLRTLTGHSGKVMSADFAPDERHVISGGFDRTVKLWAHKDEF